MASKQTPVSGRNLANCHNQNFWDKPVFVVNNREASFLKIRYPEGIRIWRETLKAKEKRSSCFHQSSPVFEKHINHVNPEPVCSNWK